MLKARWSVLVVSVLKSLIILRVQGDSFRQTVASSGSGLTTCEAEGDTSRVDVHVSQKALLQSDYVRRVSEEGRPAKEGHNEKPSKKDKPPKKLDSRKGRANAVNSTPGAKQLSAFKFTTPRPTGLPPVFSSAAKRHGQDKSWKKGVHGKHRKRVHLPAGLNMTTGRASKWTGSKFTSPVKENHSALPKDADLLEDQNVARVNDVRMAAQTQRKPNQTQLQPPTLPPSLLASNQTDSSNLSVHAKAEVLANQSESTKAGEGVNQTGASQLARATESSDVWAVSVHDDIADPDCEPGGQCVHGHLAKKSPHRALCVVSSVLATTKMCWDVCNLAHEPDEYFAGINRSSFPKETAVKALLDLRRGAFSGKVKCPNPNPSAHANITERDFWLAEAKKDSSMPSNTSVPAMSTAQVSGCTGKYQSYIAKAHPGCGFEDGQTKENVTVEDALQYCCEQSWCTGVDHYAEQNNTAYYCSVTYDANVLVSMEPSISFRKGTEAVNALLQTKASVHANVSMAANASVANLLGMSSATVAAVILDLPDPGCKLAGPCSNSTLPKLRGVCVQPQGTAEEETRQCWDVCNTSHPPQDYFRGDPSAKLLVEGIMNVRNGRFLRVRCPRQMDHTDFPLRVDEFVEKSVDAVNVSAKNISAKSRETLDVLDRAEQGTKKHARKAESGDLRRTAHISEDATEGQKKLAREAFSDAMEGNSAIADDMAREEKEHREEEAKSLQALAKYRQELAEIKREELDKALAAAEKAEKELKRLKQSEAEAEAKEEANADTDKLALTSNESPGSAHESSWAAETDLQPFSSGQPTMDVLTDQSLQAAAQKAVRSVSAPSANASVKASMPAVKRESLAAIQSGSSLVQTAQLEAEAQMQEAAADAEAEELKALKEAEKQAVETEKFVQQEEKEIKEELFDSVVGQYNKNRQRLEKDLFKDVVGLFGESKHREDEEDIGDSLYKPHKKRHRKKSHNVALATLVSTASRSDDATVGQAPAEEAGKPKVSLLAQWLR